MSNPSQNKYIEVSQVKLILSVYDLFKWDIISSGCEKSLIDIYVIMF